MQYWCRVANSRSFTAYSHGFTAAPRRIDFAKTNHATFLYTTARLHPFSMQLPTEQERQSMPEALLRQQHGSWERTRRAKRPQPDGGDAHRAKLPDHARYPPQGRAARVRCTTKSIATKESYRLSSTCGAPRNHTNVPPVYARLTTVTSISCRSL